MQFRIKIDPNAQEELILRVREMDERAMQLQRLAADLLGDKTQIKLRMGDTEYYVARSGILFFESGEHRTLVHTAKDIYETEQRLYLLEQVLPQSFVRCSRSCILNARAVSSVTKQLTGGAEITFAGSAKRAFASRMYYKSMMERIDGIRL